MSPEEFVALALAAPIESGPAQFVWFGRLTATLT